MKKTNGISQEEKSKYQLVKLVKSPYTYKDEEDPLPTIDTHVVKPSLAADLFKSHKLLDMTPFSSYNDIFAVRMALAKYKKHNAE